VNDLPMVAAFGVVVVVLLALVSYMLYRRAVEMGHAPGKVSARLLVFWLGCLLALAVGIYFHRLYPQGLFSVNFSGGEQPLALVGGPQSRGPLLLALLGLIAGALMAWLAIRPLQNPPPDAPEEKPE
jgi:hypothetical protein